VVRLTYIYIYGRKGGKRLIHKLIIYGKHVNQALSRITVGLDPKEDQTLKEKAAHAGLRA
jgi:hypothetical protein